MVTLMNAELKKRFKEIGRQGRSKKDPLVIAKFIARGATPIDWYATEYYPSEQLFFGFVCGLVEGSNGVWGYFSLEGLEGSSVAPDGALIKPDPHFKEAVLSKAYRKPFPRQYRRCWLSDFWFKYKRRLNLEYEFRKAMRT